MGKKHTKGPLVFWSALLFCTLLLLGYLSLSGVGFGKIPLFGAHSPTTPDSATVPLPDHADSGPHSPKPAKPDKTEEKPLSPAPTPSTPDTEKEKPAPPERQAPQDTSNIEEEPPAPPHETESHMPSSANL